MTVQRNRIAAFLSFLRIIRLALIFVICSGGMLQAQEVRIRVLNGRNGKPIRNECLNVWTGISHGAHMVAVTNQDGVAILHIVGAVVETNNGCAGWPAQISGGPEIDGIMVSADRYVACQENSKPIPGQPPTDPLQTMPFYPIRSILQFGVSSSNECGKIREKAKPGELIFFVKPRGFWGSLRE